jgi:putative DNA primase/helicase
MLKYEQASVQTTPHDKYDTHNYTDNSIFDKARGNWPSILESFGIHGSYLKNKHGSCPVCGGKDRFRFDDRAGRGTFICNCCGAGDGFQLLQLYLGYSRLETFQAIAKLIGFPSLTPNLSNPKYMASILNPMMQSSTSSQKYCVDIKKFERLKNILKASVPITIGDPVDYYLRARGIKLSVFSSELYYHAKLPYYEDKKLLGYFPAMLAKVQNENGQVVTLHRTYLGDGCKANVLTPKKLMPAIKPGASIGAAIKLYEPIDGKLALAEGIETALAFNFATQLPIWATVSALGMEKVVLPSSVSEVVIAADNDASGCGQEAAANLMKRLLAERRSVRYVMPPIVGHDFNDVLLKGGI